MKKAIKQFIRKNLQRAVGLRQIQEELDTLFFFLNQYHDIKQFPKATGALRDIQVCDTFLLYIADEICRKHNLRYWLSCGNLIGAIRHQGSIPWDDDADIYICRSDYEKALLVFKDELCKYDIFVEEMHPLGAIGIAYNHPKTGVWLDIFPVDFFNIPEPIDINIKALYQKLDTYREKYLKKKNTLSKKSIQKMKQKMVPYLCVEEESSHCCRAAEFSTGYVIQSSSTLFPFRLARYEIMDLVVPNCPEEYLNDLLKGNCMEFPRYGILRHGENGGLPLYKWAERAGTDMNEVKKYLLYVWNQVRSGMGEEEIREDVLLRL